MAVLKKTTTNRYIGLAADTKPTGVPAGSVFDEYDTGLQYITYDGTNWVRAPIAFSYKHLAASGQVKASKGRLHALTINRPDTTAGAIITVYDNTESGGTIIAIITMDKAVYVVPVTLVYNITFATGLYVTFSHAVTADITVLYN